MKKLVLILSVVFFLAVYTMPVQASPNVDNTEQTQNDGDKDKEKAKEADKKNCDANTQEKEGCKKAENKTCEKKESECPKK